MKTKGIFAERTLDRMPFGKWVQNGLTVIVLAMSLVMTACSDEETPSAVDKGVWTINYANADYKVNPGDDFFMYCNGGFWQLATGAPGFFRGCPKKLPNCINKWICNYPYILQTL